MTKSVTPASLRPYQSSAIQQRKHQFINCKLTRYSFCRHHSRLINFSKQAELLRKRGTVPKLRNKMVIVGVGVAELVGVRPSEQEVPTLILGDFDVCFDFPQIRVAIALNTRKMEH